MIFITTYAVKKENIVFCFFNFYYACISVIQYKLVHNKFKKYRVIFILLEYVFCVISVDFF